MFLHQVITGTAVGMESCALPTLVIVAALLGSYYLGADSGIVDAGTGEPIAGFFGTAVATMGMLSSASFVLTMDFFGPISDNAGGVVEMAGEPEEVRSEGVLPSFHRPRPCTHGRLLTHACAQSPTHPPTHARPPARPQRATRAP